MSKKDLEVIIATDCGSTTTKAILIEKKGDTYRQTFRGEAPTTVEAPFEDVTRGVLNSITEVEDLSGRKLLDGEKIITPNEGNTGADIYVSTSSAGGGLQMMGKCIHDPLGIEGEPGSSAGLELLEFDTTLAAEKQLRNVVGTLMLGDAPVAGYEIHAGISAGPALQHPALRLEHGLDGAVSPDGAISGDGQILATYLHGLFESRQATDALLRWAGLGDASTPDYHARREADIDRLAEAVEQHLDGKRLRALFGLGEST